MRDARLGRCRSGMNATDDKPSSPVASEAQTQDNDSPLVPKKRPYMKPAYRMEKCFAPLLSPAGRYAGLHLIAEPDITGGVIRITYRPYNLPHPNG